MLSPRYEVANPVGDLPARAVVDGATLEMLRRSTTISRPLSRRERIRENALLSCSDWMLHSFAAAAPASAVEWLALLNWLDVSGLALYFLDRMKTTGQQDCLPAEVLESLESRQKQNQQRTSGMLRESTALQRDFQEFSITYAVLKGLSLAPDAVPRPELRHQFDIDFLIAPDDASAAVKVLERHGYTLFASSGKTLEFKKGQTPHVSAKDLYRDLPYRGVELHIDHASPGTASRLERIIFRKIGGLVMPVLSPADILLGQAMHALKDITSPFLRASHLLEFYRHVQSRSHDDMFWQELRQRAQSSPRARLAVGVSTWLSVSLWGSVATVALTSWSSDQLPRGVQLWLKRYGRSAALQTPPGTKRYVLLQRELEAVDAVSQQQLLPALPSRLPPVVIQSGPGESLLMRAARYRVQVRFLVSRVRFHVVEGLRLALEARRWRRLRTDQS